MAGKLEIQDGEDPLLAYASSVPGTGDSEVGKFVRENVRCLLKEAVEMAEKEEE